MTKRRGYVMYMILRRVTVQPGMVEEAVRRMARGLAPIVSREPGLIAFYLVQVGERTGVIPSPKITRVYNLSPKENLKHAFYLGGKIV
jgi:Antibiotic biosynthesis monooxygenase